MSEDPIKEQEYEPIKPVTGGLASYLHICNVLDKMVGRIIAHERGHGREMSEEKARKIVESDLRRVVGMLAAHRVGDQVIKDIKEQIL